MCQLLLPFVTDLNSLLASPAALGAFYLLQQILNEIVKNPQNRCTVLRFSGLRTKFQGKSKQHSAEKMKRSSEEYRESKS